MEELKKISINELAQIIKKSKQKGQCLYLNSCLEEPINAHSISKSYLKLISKDGKVYTLKNNMFGYLNNLDSIKMDLKGIGEATTFLGFCSKHDNDLFSSIDDEDFHFSKEQAFLYAYRSIGHQLTIRNQLLSYYPKIVFPDISNEEKINLELLKAGLINGTNILFEHKKKYDEILKSNNFTSIRYTLFILENEPSLLFSGVTLPDFDFQGNTIQDIADYQKLHQLLAFSSVKLSNEKHGILFIWDKSSDFSCISFFNSLKTAMKENTLKSDFIADLLFRFVIGRCDNFVINPSWYDDLADHKKELLIKVLKGIYVYPDWEHPNSLNIERDDIINWKIKYVHENIPDVL